MSTGTMTRARQVVAPIQLRGIEAWWVLGAHAYALIVPFVMAAQREAAAA